MAKMTTMGVKLDDTIRNRLKQLGESRDRTPHWLMKKAITDFLDQEEALDKRNQEADVALREYQATGQYVSHENMEDWLNTWGSDKESTCPELEN
ncbi:antitoxin [Bathymodiolus platifrons methanotrophic gill symbiont]|uniref:CopG family ribbon-helix-helix protein n=1 Tax=Bathymodiolus platifrons methanotrophic gill symbiont TaxID=113268 RepID=UPI001B77DEB6|nr:CopG family transcriptional regulator [Bathymodiolus platifrons methanotrophic gill symbiont]GFO75221.1 antitoxin [Bathymodiolus platifrons methanotrophic gill symbiont]